MKIKKISNQLFRTIQRKTKNKAQTPLPLIKEYVPIDITREEFQAYIHYLASNKINKTFIEPAQFITEAERAQKEVFKDRIHYLAANKINLTFYC